VQFKLIDSCPVEDASNIHSKSSIQNMELRVGSFPLTMHYQNKLRYAEGGGTAFVRSDSNLDNSRCCTSYIFGLLASDTGSGEM
jgi:hypothetical protein